MAEQPNQIALSLFGANRNKIEEFADRLSTEGELRGLIGPKEASRIWSRHIINSAALLPFLPEEGSVMDIGSGAGLPGIVIAIARPNLQVTLVEPMERRTEWLQEIVDELDLSNVSIFRARSQDLPENMQADVVTARALAALPKLLRITHMLVKPEGQLLALKGQRAYQEVADARNELRKFGFQAEVEEVVSVLDGEVTYVVNCRRN